MTGETEGGPAAPGGWRWDVALSFAGSQREYVEQVAAALKARGVRCFYDADEQIDLWGKYLAEELPAIYSERAAAVVVFVSADYAARDWTRHERRAALNRAVRERREYVLPAHFDDTPLPGLLSDLVAVDLRGRTPQQFAVMVADKLANLGITARLETPQRPADASFQFEELAGARVLKMAHTSGKVALCDLRSDGSLIERWLPLSPEQAASWEDKVWKGHWLVTQKDVLRLVVDPYELDLRAERSGLHLGVERRRGFRPLIRPFAISVWSEKFAAVLVDRRFDLPASEPWTAVKLGEHGVRRTLVCKPGGSLEENHLFNEDRRTRPGTWEGHAGEVTVTVSDWTLTATQFRPVPGIWLGLEHKGAQNTGGFALVRYRHGRLISPS